MRLMTYNPQTAVLAFESIPASLNRTPLRVALAVVVSDSVTLGDPVAVRDSEVVVLADTDCVGVRDGVGVGVGPHKGHI